MKKVITIMAAAALAATLAACSAPAASSSGESASSAAAESAASTAVATSSEAASSAAAPSAAASSTAASSAAASSVKWTKATSAADAAKGAGFETFGVMDVIEADEMEFKKPQFAYAEGVAQAMYETGAAAIDVRKADGTHKTALTDRDKTEFASTWSKSYEGLDVSCYGMVKDAATVITWADGTKEYGVTFQGLGGEELAFTSDEVAAIVKGIKEADASGDKAEAEDEKSSDSAEAADDTSDSNGPNFDMEAAVFNAGLGELLYYNLVQGDDGNWYWEVVTRGSDGDEYTSYLDGSGNVIQGGIQKDNDNVSGMVENAVWNNGLGELISSEQVQGSDGNWYWKVTTRGADGGEAVSYIDSDGDVVQGGIDEADGQENDFVENSVQENGLGELVSYEQVQGEDGNWYTRVVTRGADGDEVVSYLDGNGNPVQGGIDVSDNYLDGEVRDSVWENGLGELVSYEQVQGEDGNWYTRVTTRGADGNEAVSYIDSSGDVVQGGIEESSSQSSYDNDTSGSEQ